ncbi:MAG: hypothetical protein IJG52_05865 [Lachnospiraceae bacterium]|nr:hypothetical protein [Lachnospiraceae bacterium]
MNVYPFCTIWMICLIALQYVNYFIAKNHVWDTFDKGLEDEGILSGKEE